MTWRAECANARTHLELGFGDPGKLGGGGGGGGPIVLEEEELAGQ